MGRPRKTTAELEMNGAFKKDPQRKAARANEPLPNGPIGEPPAWLEDDQRDIWTEIIELVPDGVLAKSDRLVVETLTVMVHKQRQGAIRASEINILISCLARLGLTPADRSRVGVAPATDEDGEEDDFGTFVKVNGPIARAN